MILNERLKLCISHECLEVSLSALLFGFVSNKDQGESKLSFKERERERERERESNVSGSVGLL